MTTTINTKELVDHARLYSFIQHEEKTFGSDFVQHELRLRITLKQSDAQLVQEAWRTVSTLFWGCIALAIWFTRSLWTLAYESTVALAYHTTNHDITDDGVVVTEQGALALPAATEPMYSQEQVDEVKNILLNLPDKTLDNTN